MMTSAPEPLEQIAAEKGPIDNTPPGSPDRIPALLEEIAALHDKKSADYTGGGDADPLDNYKQMIDLGMDPWLYVFCRATEKFSRAKSWVRRRSYQCSDTFREELIDMALLFLIITALIDEQNNPPSAQDREGEVRV